MGIAFFEASNKKGTQLPFLDKWLEISKAYNEEFILHSIRLCANQEGYLLEFTFFSIYLYASKPIVKQIIATLEKYVEEQHGYAIVILTQEKYPYYQIGIDEERVTNWSYSQGKYTPGVIIGTNLEDSTDITFLSPLPIRTQAPMNGTGKKTTKDATRGA